MSPIYDFRCSKCGKDKKDVFVHSWDDEVKCDDCDTKMKKLFSGFPVPHVFPAEGIFLEHVSSEGKRFHSKQEMKDYAKKHDLELGALD